MKFYIALLMCLMLSGCSRCWDEVCTLSCEQVAEQNGSDPGACSADTTQNDAIEADDAAAADATEADDAVEIGDITVEDAEEVSLDATDVVPTIDVDATDDTSD